jgi:rSAM/selenodomain-associated transferase 1
MSGRSADRPGHLCIFARAPELGTVKSRLANTMGEAEALRAYGVLVETCLEQLAHTPQLHVELWIAGSLDHEGVTGWSTRWNLPLRAQQGPDLGARMANAVEASLVRAPSVILVGTDCPTLDGGYLESAVQALDQHDLVLGPAEDGGYGLIGLRRPTPTLFQAMPWGTESVAGETLARAHRLQLRVALLDVLWDVDTAPDWQRFQEWSR